jgi:predicted nucleic acid-binding protein
LTHYFDTSALVAYYCPEPISDAVEKILLQSNQPAISLLTEVELTSAVARKVREDNLSHQDGNRILNQFQSHLEHRMFRWIPIEEHHFRQARNWISQFTTPLRTLDALHLALAAGEGTHLVTADLQLARAAAFYGVEVIPLGEPLNTSPLK